MSDHAGASAQQRPFGWRKGAELVGATATWAWFIVAGCGGLGLIIETGPWPPTHGWFAMFSGFSACPLTAWASKKYLRVALSWPVRIGAAALFVLAGRLALRFLWPRLGQPANQPDWMAIFCGTVLLITILVGVLASSRKPG